MADNVKSKKKKSTNDENTSKAEGFNLFPGSAEYRERLMDRAGIDEIEQDDVKLDMELGHEVDMEDAAHDDEYDDYRERTSLYSVDMTRRNMAQAVKIDEVQKLRGYDLTVKREMAERGLSRAARKARKTKSVVDDAYVAEVMAPEVEDKVADKTVRVFEKSDFDIDI